MYDKVYKRGLAMEKRIIIRYLRDEENNPYGVVVATSPANIGWSMCSDKDRWSKQLAKQIALGRARKITDWHEHLRDHSPISGQRPAPERWQNLYVTLTKVEEIAAKYLE